MKKHIVLICGSGSKNSHTRALLEHIEALLQAKSVKTTMWDLVENPLPPTDPDFRGSLAHPNLTAREFIHLIKSADGLVLGSPLYHGSFTGIIKNALDHLGSEALKNKHVGLVCNAGGAGNIQAVEQLRSVVRSLYGYALQTQIVTTEADYTDNRGYAKIYSATIEQRALRLIEELVFFTQLMHNSVL